MHNNNKAYIFCISSCFMLSSHSWSKSTKDNFPFTFCREGPLVNLLVFSLFLRVPCGLYMLRSITLAMYQNITSRLSYSNSRSFPQRVRKLQPCQHVNIVFSIMNTLFMQYTTSNALKHLTDLGLRASKFSVLKLFEIIILRVYYTIPFGFSLIRHVLDISFQLLKILFWLRITDEGSVPEMRIWSIL